MRVPLLYGWLVLICGSKVQIRSFRGSLQSLWNSNVFQVRLQITGARFNPAASGVPTRGCLVQTQGFGRVDGAPLSWRRYSWKRPTVQPCFGFSELGDLGISETPSPA